jgi:hypothetical protein
VAVALEKGMEITHNTKKIEYYKFRSLMLSEGEGHMKKGKKRVVSSHGKIRPSVVGPRNSFSTLGFIFFEVDHAN